MPTAVLLSGGLDSAVLLAEEAANDEVQPIYISVGLAWEAAEREALRHFLAEGFVASTVRPLVELTVDMTDVYLPGRNIVLLGKSGVFCAAAKLGRLVIGTLDHNPFPDATPQFREAMAGALSLGLDHRIEIAAPYARIGKAEVIGRGQRTGVRLELTLSCMNARKNGDRFPRHCGVCSKCRERHDAFKEAGVADPTDYADRAFTG